MKGQSEIAYLPKFADLYVKLELDFSDSQSNFLHFELLVASLAQILTELQSFDLFWGDPMTSSMKQSTIICKGIFTIQLYICTLSLKMIYSFFSYHGKCYFFSFIKEYRETTLRAFCDVIDDVIIMKIFFLHSLGRSFHS